MSTRQIDNSIISADQRATQKDPLIMHIVVDYKSYSSKQQLYTDLLIASLKSERILSIRSEYKKQFDQWWSSSFRKIVLRAKPNRWKTVSNRKDSVTCNGVAITAPVRRSERDSLFSKLQVLTDLDQLKDDLQQQTAGTTLLVKENLSLGKTLAQLSHAILKHSLVVEDLPLAGDLDNLFAFIECRQIIAKPEYTLIHDAGLTEVDPGTLTVAVY